MDAATAGLLGVLAGGVFGLLGAALTSWSQGRSEEARWRRARHDDLDRAHREAIQNLVRIATRATQRMHWLAWASREPGGKPEEAFAAYDDEMRDLLPDLFAAAAVLDMLIGRPDPQISGGATPAIRIVTRITEADALLGEAEIKLRSGSEWKQDLAAGFNNSLAIHHDLLSGYPWLAERVSPGS